MSGILYQIAFIAVFNAHHIVSNAATSSGIQNDITTQAFQSTAQMTAEQQVYNRIRSGYEAAIRPLVNPAATLIVQVKIKLQQIVALNERTQVLTTLVFIEQTWQDEHLRWNDSEFHQVRTLRVPAKYVWTPDTYVFNNADTSSSGFLKGLHVLVHNSGQVIWQVPMQMKTSCSVDIIKFPFDEQVCDIQMGSWIYQPKWVTYRFQGSLTSGSPVRSPYPGKIIAMSACHGLDNTHAALDTSSFWESSEWMLIGAELLHSSRSTTKLSAWKMGFGRKPSNTTPAQSFNETTQSDLILRLHLKRRSFFYLWNIVVPCVMLTLLTITVFCTPVQSGEKITLGLSVFLAFSMFMVLIAEKVPPTSTGIPLIGIYMTSVMTLTALSVVICVIVINLDSRGDKLLPVPPWLRHLVNLRLIRMMTDTQTDPIEAAIKLEHAESLMDKHVSTAVQLANSKAHAKLLQSMHTTLINQTKVFTRIHHCLHLDSRDKPEVMVRSGLNKLTRTDQPKHLAPLTVCSPSPTPLLHQNQPHNHTQKSASIRLRNMSTKPNKYLPDERNADLCLIELKRGLRPRSLSTTPQKTNSPRPIKDKQNTTRFTSTVPRDHIRESCVPCQQRYSEINHVSSAQENHALIKYEWKLVAQLVDRFVFALFVLSTGLCYTLVFLWPFLVPTDFNCAPG